MKSLDDWRCLAIWPLYGAAIIIAMLLQGCVPSGTRPDDMSAEAHRAAARAEQQQVAEHIQQYDPEAEATRQPDYLGRNDSYNPTNFYGLYGYGYASDDYFWNVGSYNPSQGHLVASKQLESHADDHLAAAQALEAFEEAECRAFPPETRAVPPLLGQIESVEDIYGGVSLNFKEDVNVNAAIAHMHCHVAFARTRGRIGMESCPLYLPGIAVDRRGNADIVELTIGEPSQLRELRQRVREHLDVDLAE